MNLSIGHLKLSIQRTIKKKTKTNEENLWASWDIIKRNNLYVIGFPEREDREEGTEKLKKTLLRTSQSWGEIWTSKFMNLGSQTYSTQKILSKTYYNKTVKNQ